MSNSVAVSMYKGATRRRKKARPNLSDFGNSLHSGRSLRGSLHSAVVKSTKAALRGGKRVGKEYQKGVSYVQRAPSKNYTWKDLLKIEKRRRAILQRKEISFLGVLLFWDGTVLSALAVDPFFYILMSLFTSIRIVARFQIPDFVSSVGAANTGIIGGFLSFFLALYVNSANERFKDMYQNSRHCQGGIFDAAALARTTLPRERALRLLRYLNAAHIAGYIGLTPVYTFDNFFVHANRAKSLLSQTEVKRMKRIVMDEGGSAYRELVVWAMAEVTSAQKAKLMDHRTVHCYRELIFRLRGTFGSLYDYADQPIGFFYVHFVVLLSALYLPLFTVQVALEAGTKQEDLYWVNDILSGLLVILQAVYVLGLRYIADNLSDPYGDDLEDLSILEYIDSTWLYSRRMLEAELPSEPTIEEEDYLVAKAEQGIGEAWETEEDPWDSDVSDSNLDIESVYDDSEDSSGGEVAQENGTFDDFRKGWSVASMKANLDSEVADVEMGYGVRNSRQPAHRGPEIGMEISASRRSASTRHSAGSYDLGNPSQLFQSARSSSERVGAIETTTPTSTETPEPPAAALVEASESTFVSCIESPEAKSRYNFFFT